MPVEILAQNSSECVEKQQLASVERFGKRCLERFLSIIHQRDNGILFQVSSRSPSYHTVLSRSL